MDRLDPAFYFFYKELSFESTARLDYKFVVGSSWILDPRNPNKVKGGFGDNSELAMPQFVQPSEASLILTRHWLDRVPGTVQV